MKILVTVTILGFLFFSGCKPPQLAVTEKAGLVMSRMYEKKWTNVVQSITNLDSLICDYIEKNKSLEICQSTFDNLSPIQKEKITIAEKYSGGSIVFIDKKEEDTNAEHATRLLFCIYEKYFDHLEPGDLALEITVTKSALDGSKDLYLLKKDGSEYTISYLLGTFGL